MWTSIILLGSMALVLGTLLGYAAIRFKVEGDPVADQIEAILPQLQCGKCGYPGCRPYAEALAKGEAAINQCSPGGETGMLSLARMLDREPKPLGEEYSEEKPKMVAVIEENLCVGCTLCIQACPVDAILGTVKQMHTVIKSECTGCELCINACPVNCINMVPLPQELNTWKWPYPMMTLVAVPVQR